MTPTNMYAKFSNQITPPSIKNICPKFTLQNHNHTYPNLPYFSPSRELTISKEETLRSLSLLFKSVVQLSYISS